MRKSSVEVNLASKLPCVVSVDVEGTLISGKVEYLGNFVCHATFVYGSITLMLEQIFVDVNYFCF